MPSYAVCSTCRELLIISRKVYDFLAKHFEKTVLLVLDDHQDCCDNPDYYWLFSSRHLTLEKVKKWSQKTITSSG